MSGLALTGSSETLRSRFGDGTGLVYLSAALAALLALTILLSQFDPRLISGISIWDKPAKFSLSLALHAMTLVWGLGLIPAAERNSRPISWAAAVFIIAVIFEMSWMVFQASRGEASHFNNSTAFHTFMYSVMGVFAVSMTMVTIFIGWKIARAGNTPMHLATGGGFILAGVLTTLVAGCMSSGTSHSVGGDLTDATGLMLLNWSTTGGDLRVPHFAALHIAQAAPFIGWVFPDRRVIVAGFALAVVTVGLLFAQALMGIPLLRP